MLSPRPSTATMAAFGCHGLPVALPGGQQAAYRVGCHVFKPADLPPAALSWQAEVVPRLPGDRIRLTAPVAAADGRLVVDGWTAWGHLDGDHQPGRWPEVIAAGTILAELLAGQPRPAFLDARADRWAVADRVAWGEADLPAALAGPTVVRLLRARQPVDAPSGLVHADLTGNVLFHETQPPAVLDLSMYWRPAAYGSAVVVVDAVTFRSAPDRLVRELRRQPDGDQLLLRALIFRIVTDLLAGRGDRDVAGRYHRVLGLLPLAMPSRSTCRAGDSARGGYRLGHGTGG
ncbi:MAG TPA: hypothetical protein VFJ97_15695 [Dermatophilaceae bacterium]|nr:hypothetical protein [Dermatophilaceae bacterium]